MISRTENSGLRCSLCARYCILREGETGFCGVRRNRGGKNELTSYGRIVAAHVDTVEKKPAYHFWPGAKTLSIGTVGCNWSCDYCLNSHIAQTKEPRGERIAAEEVVDIAKKYGCRAIAYTYNEPMIWLDFARDIGKEARSRGLLNLLVTNGYGTPESMATIREFVDCAVVGIKASLDPEFHAKYAAVSNPDIILENLTRFRTEGIHIEIGNLIVPDIGDDETRTKNLADWIVENVGPDTPFHLIRFLPAYNLAQLTPTPPNVLASHHRKAREAGLRFVYVENLPGHEFENTFCPICGKQLVRRCGYDIQRWELDENNSCPSCGARIPIHGKFTHVAAEERYVPVIFPPMDLLHVCEGLVASRGDVNRQRQSEVRDA